MPTSITPPPKDDEVECGNCGAYIYHDLLKCPNCGVYLIEPNEPEEERPTFHPKSKFALAMERLMRKLRREPHPAEELFTGAMREAALFDDLLRNPPVGEAATGPWWSGSSSMNEGRNRVRHD